jgi:CRISPR system Cascade subunit CasA
MLANNLLIDGIFRARLMDGTTQLMSLPKLLAALGKNEVECLPGLRCHQEDVFHIFLCYLAGAALARQKEKEAAQDESFWRKSIESLSPKAAETGWCLLVDDCNRPAFMQPPNATLCKITEIKARSPDELDVLQTAKNHDVKTRRAVQPLAEEWAYSLISLQTSSGFLGQGNYGIARMNGGFGSRACVSLVYSESPGGRFCRDVTRLLEFRPKLLSDMWPYKETGIVLTWIEPWDGTSSLALSELDPFFIETARIIRLRKSEKNIVAAGVATKASRIHCKDLNGVVGDCWTPIKSGGKSKITSLTIGKAGFTPDKLRELIFEDGYEPCAMQIPSSIDGDCVLRASVLVRGQGTTDGFHLANVPIPGKVAASLFSKSSLSKSLGELSKIGISDAGTMQNKVLGVSLFSLLEAGPEKINFDKTELSAWVTSAKKSFSEAWADEFFPWLWSTVDEMAEARLRWLNKLRSLAEDAFERAMKGLPARSGRAFRARASADSAFYGALFKNFPELKEGGKTNGIGS